MSDFESRARKAAKSVRDQIEESTAAVDSGISRAKRSQLRTTLPSTALVLLIVAAGLFVINRNDDSSSGGSPFQLAGSLQSFSACDDTLKYFQDQAPEYYADQLNGRAYATSAEAPATTTIPFNSADKAAGDAPDYSGITADGNEAAPAFSTTNVQEVGVDEPDTIKTDGNVIVTVNAGSVYVLQANNGQPQVKAKVSYGGDFATNNVLLSGSRLILFGGNGKAEIKTYDISDLSNPKLVGDLTIDGELVDARMVGSQVRASFSFTPDPDIPTPQNFDNDGKLTPRAADALRTDLDQTTLKDWAPQFTEKDGNGNTLASGQLVSCDNLAHPSVFAGLNTVSLITFDANGMPAPAHSVGVLGDGDTLYATADNTYLSSTKWQRGNVSADVAQTDIHKFITAKSGVSTYAGSGTVDGRLLSSYSMSEASGVLRVATTVTGSRGIVRSRQVSEGVVTTLRNSENRLQQVGRVGGLGKNDNESITAVRFAGERAYVSTARQTDPFYVIDLSDAANPKMVGELKIPGSSSYLQPLANDLVLAVGQSGAFGFGPVEPLGPLAGSGSVSNDTAIARNPASSGSTSGGATTGPVSPGAVAPVDPGVNQPILPGDGPQLEFSLFDVSNPASPKRVGLLSYAGGQAGAQFDPHAFLYWQPRNLVIAPATVYNIDGLNQFSGLLLMQADGKDLKEIGRLADTEYNGKMNGFNVTRTIVIDDLVYMLSNDNLQVDSLDTHAQVAAVSLKA